MRILIDGSIFAETDRANDIAFWTEAIPSFAANFPHHFLYLLNRDSVNRFKDATNLKNLWAPGLMWERSALEDRRLAALCHELGIDVFVSTNCTSAGTRTASLLVTTDVGGLSRSDVNPTSSLVAISARRAAKMASHLWPIPQGRSDSINPTLYLLERELRLTAEMELDEKIKARRETEERLTIAQAAQIQSADLQKAIEKRWDYLRREAEARQPTLHARFLSAIKSLLRFPQMCLISLKHKFFSPKD